MELFKISRISNNRQPPVCYLRDLADQEITGYFYEEELNRVRKDLSLDIFEVDKVLDGKGKGPRKKYLVSWRGYPSKFNS